MRKLTAILLFLIFGLLLADSSIPQISSVKYSEQMLDIYWQEVPKAAGYNIYTRTSEDPKKRNRKVNKNLITSGRHFAFIWEFVNNKRVRKIKGYEHIVSIEAVFKDGSKSKLSQEKDNFYFQGFRNILDSSKIISILDNKQHCAKLSIDLVNNNLSDFIKFMTSDGRALHKEISDSINPLQVGGCAPVTTILISLLYQKGLYAYKAEGKFIKEYHSFAVIKIDEVEYILDFTADQFLPKVSPVMIPRDNCFLSSHGRLSEKGTPIYTVGRLFKPKSVSLKDSPESKIYKNIKLNVLKKAAK